jgi:hypothetical protein
VEFEATDLAAAREHLVRAGWLECARRGKGRDRWAWQCARCNPTLLPARDRLGPSVGQLAKRSS